MIRCARIGEKKLVIYTSRHRMLCNCLKSNLNNPKSQSPQKCTEITEYYIQIKRSLKIAIHSMQTTNEVKNTLQK